MAILLLKLIDDLNRHIVYFTLLSIGLVVMRSLLFPEIYRHVASPVPFTKNYGISRPH